MNASTAFPQKIDDLLFYQDIDAAAAGISDHYQKLLRSGRYTEAADYLQKTGLPHYGADLFNLIENRIHAVQTYLSQNDPPTNPHIISETEPSDAPPDAIWIN